MFVFLCSFAGKMKSQCSFSSKRIAHTNTHTHRHAWLKCIAFDFQGFEFFEILVFGSWFLDDWWSASLV